MILVKQFRPPIGKYTIENPAGNIRLFRSLAHEFFVFESFLSAEQPENRSDRW
jgi:hypothetical protein